MPDSAKINQLQTNVPLCVRERQQWLVTHLTERDGKFTKPPFRVSDGKIIDTWVPKPGDLSTLDEALAALPRLKFDHIGFCLTGTPFLCSDLDHCFLEKAGEELRPWALEYIDAHRSLIFYAERSPSGDGLHLWHDLRGAKKNSEDKKKERRHEGGKIELFLANYVTVTGEAWGSFDELPMDAKGLRQLLGYFDQAKPKEKNSTTLTQARVGEDQVFALLMKGKHLEAGYADCSAADFKLCRLLAKKFNGDPEMIEQVWMGSGLARDKSKERADYRRSTIEKALAEFKPKPSVSDGSDWRAGCKSFNELSSAAPEFLLKDLIPAGALTAIPASSYNCKTWLALAAAKAISTAEPLWCFDGPSKPVPVIYHVPEMNEAFVRQRMVALDIRESENFLVRPMELGLWPLDDARMLRSSEGRVVFLDTAGYFNPAEDASNYQQSLEFAKLIFNLLSQGGSRAVIGLFHPPKYATQDKKLDWTLENSILGSAGYGGILRSCLRMQNLNADLNDPNVWVYVQGLKNPGLKPFQLQGLPLSMKVPPGESGYLRDLDLSVDPRRAEAFKMFDQKVSVSDIRKNLKVKNLMVSKWKKEWLEEKEAGAGQTELESAPF